MAAASAGDTGFVQIASPTRSCDNSRKARVIPQPGHGTPVTEWNAHAGSRGSHPARSHPNAC
jgi:hypothetical protein